MAKVIKAENLSKAYQLGDFGTGTISRDLERFWARIRGKEDPFLKIGEVNDRTKKSASDIVWSLKNINFDIEQGDSVGIIGRNGAGKSTLLKILSRVTSPTTGSVKIKGRIASLLEVGTGFHPELTGRENIYLNGAILGMRKAEIKRKFDEIVDFSGIERYVDTPVKRYSSGMYVRLAFAVAAHLESEILIIDEVLAVGDAEFQKKCLGKMRDLSKGEGRTVLFVSHNMDAVKTLCNKGMLLNNGVLDYSGSASDALLLYFNMHKSRKTSVYVGDGILKSIVARTTSKANGNFDVHLQIRIESNVTIENVVLGLVIKDIYESSIIAINNRHYEKHQSQFRKVNKGIVNVALLDIPLLSGNYTIDVFLGDTMVDLEVVQDSISISVNNNSASNLSAFPLDYHLNKFAIEQATWEFEYA
jgi:lipopolysaccharide transport system ATP-binding protein